MCAGDLTGLGDLETLGTAEYNGVHLKKAHLKAHL
jgi:hypothetical protein